MTRLKFIPAWLPMAIAGAALSWSLTAGAQPISIQPNEFAQLPSYCRYTQGFRGPDDSEKVEYWRSKLGESTVKGEPVFEAMHHYCYALAALNRALIPTQKMSPMERRGLVARSLDDMDYVLRHTPQGFVLLPEILTAKGRALILSGRASEAAATMTRAMEIKPDYWPPYAYLSDYYRDAGDIAKARAVLRKGLEHSPGVKAISRRLEELEADKGKGTSKSPPAAGKVGSSVKQE